MKKPLSYLAFALVASTSSLAFAVPAAPDTCGGEICQDDEICQILEAEDCSCPTVVPGDWEDEDVAPCECNTEPVIREICVPAPPPQCESDKDCAGDDVCVTYTFGQCSGSSPGSVEPGGDNNQEDYPVNPDDNCTEETESICVPKYAAPCEAASDCGSGFTCETPEVCTVNGGAAEPVECGEEDDCNADPVEPVEPVCMPSEGDAYCQLIQVECTKASDCGEGSTCEPQDQGLRPAIACDEGSECNDPVPEPSVSYCVPDGYGAWTSGGGSTTVDGKTVDSAKRTSFFDNSGDGGGDKEVAGGCQVSQGPTGLGAASLLFLGLVFGFRRKKN